MRILIHLSECMLFRRNDGGDAILAKNKKRNDALAIGVGIGVVIGVFQGHFTNNLVIGIVIGIIIGIVF